MDVLFYVAWAILKVNEAEPLQCDSMLSLYLHSGSVTARMWQTDKLLKLEHELKSTVIHEDLIKRREVHVQELKTWLLTCKDVNVVALTLFWVYLSETVLGLAGQTRPKIELQDVNFVHTADIHSWYRGHQKTDDVSRSWNANIGDIASFVHHMKEKAERQYQDLFFVNSEMTPTEGASPTRKPPREESHNITSRPPDSEKSNYLASNVNITDESGEDVPLAERYRNWTTRGGKGGKVAALGVSLENSKTENAKVKIQPIEKMVKEEWFDKKFLGSNPDIFLLVGHMSIRDEDRKWGTIHAAIRERHPKTPIFIFGGHTHRRDCRMNFDTAGRSIGIESGRYLETIGWVSAALTESSKPSEFVRRYLDPSKDTFLRHSGVDKKSFDTQSGKEVMRRFNELAKERGLDELYGRAPQTYNWDHEKYTKDAKNHVLNFYMNEVFPAVVTKNVGTEEPNPYFLLLNNGFMRGPVYNGEFTKDYKFVNTPYKQQFSFIRLSRLISERVLEMIDHLQAKADEAVNEFGGAYGNSVGGTVLGADEREETPLTLCRYVRHEIIGRLTATSPGYTTNDLGPGDDTIHSSPGLEIQFPPTYVHSRSPTVEKLGKYDFVDLVILHRLQDRVHDPVKAAIKMHNEFCEGQWRLCKHVATVNIGDWKQYGTMDSSDAIMEYARKDWRSRISPDALKDRC
ncbi:hypothetical protein M407DRAFT_33736 [Tulasnella calospora MUT 4182]|uniref:Putative 5'-nucleotidase C-terminal domain-containing protein n=1 Tax=Tulasnella calospora MUT 4182 TaxID=1051891 RepID=A0A0C3Q2H0_9AGAM|nr:hypothetical protein M407DRAFT_33736 [Tulasnella calospora MUT 4182]